MKRIQFLALLLAIALLSAGGIALFYNLYVVESVAIIPARATAIAGNAAGFDVNLQALTFGDVPRGGVSYRHFVVNNTTPHPLAMTLSSRGNISAYLTLSPRTAVIAAGSAQRVTAVTEFTTDAPLGNYTGTVVVELRRILI